MILDKTDIIRAIYIQSQPQNYRITDKMTNKYPFPPPPLFFYLYSLNTVQCDKCQCDAPSPSKQSKQDYSGFKIYKNRYIYIYGCERISQKALCFFFFLPASVSTSSLRLLSVSALSKGCFGPGQSKRERKATTKRERTPESFIPPFRLVNRVNAAT